VEVEVVRRTNLLFNRDARVRRVKSLSSGSPLMRLFIAALALCALAIGAQKPPKSTASDGELRNQLQQTQIQLFASQAALAVETRERDRIQGELTAALKDRTALSSAAGSRSAEVTGLRNQLNQVQASLAQAVKDRAANQEALALSIKDKTSLAAAMAKMTADTRSAAAKATTTSEQVKEIKQTQAVANDAQEAHSLRQDIASERAAETAATAKNQLDLAVALARENHSESRNTLYIQLVGFASLISGFIFKYMTDSAKSRKEAEEVDVLQRQTLEHRQLELGKIEEVRQTTVSAKQSADSAFSEANTVNHKLETIGVKMLDNKPLNPRDAAPEAAG
jgi:hypothetical protein